MRAAARELVTYDFGALGGPIGAASLATSSLLRFAGRPERAFDLLLKAHHPVLSRRTDQRILELIAAATAAERAGRPTGLWSLYDQVVAAAVSKFRKGSETRPQRHLGCRIFVVKTARRGERGVIIVDYHYMFPLLAGLFDLPTICERYDVVLEPSWADVCCPEILLFTKQQRPVYVQSIEPRDQNVLRSVGANLRAVPLGANYWVDPRREPPPGGIRDIDVIMVAAWSDIKRHWRVFRTLAALRSRGHRLRTALVGYSYDRTRQDIEDLAAHFGIRDQVETYERISQEEVFALLARSKVHVLWSRRECANRAVVEAMMADVPIIVREGMTFGHRYPYVNEQTGRFVPEHQLGDAILEVIETRNRFAPREWALANMTCVHGTRVLQKCLQDARSRDGEPWTGDLVIRSSTLDTQRYYNPGDRAQFDADYQFLESTMRPQ